MSTAIQFGAGNIGRGFIGYLLNKSGYNLVFIDVFKNVIDEINKEKSYDIYVKDIELGKISVDNVSGLYSDSQEVVDEVAKAEIITTAVGPLNLSKIAPVLAKGIIKKSEDKSQSYLNIIACENAVFASQTLENLVYDLLTDQVKEYAKKYVGFPNCSVDRIVPPSDNEKMLDVSVEKYYEWNVNREDIKGSIPKIDGMNLVDNLLAYIERKLFTLNTGHATTAYLGRLKGHNSIDKSINDSEIEQTVRLAMQESGMGLINKFGFNQEEHFQYIEKIIKRFKNPYLHDDVSRVGREPIRKLSPTERFIKPLNTALSYNLSVDNLIKGIAAALHFDDDKDQQAVKLQEMISEKGLEETIKEITEIKDEVLISEIVSAYEKVK